MKQIILIIEDNDDIREGTAEILELAGYHTLTASNGKIGVEAAIAHVPDLILCDIMMPVLDGYGVLYLLNKNPKTAHIPFIFITAKTERRDIRKGMDMGADDYLTKPFDDMELLNSVEGRFKKGKQPMAQVSSSANDISSMLSELLEQGKKRHFDKKHILYVEGDEPDVVYYVKSGQVKTYKMFKDGRELSSGLHGAGDFFGYEGVFMNINYAEHAATLAETELILIPKEDFISFLHTHPALAYSFIRLLSGNVNDMGEQMLRLAYYSVRKRVAEALLLLAIKYGEKNSDAVTLQISRDELAALVGTANETVSRMLADFKSEKLIEKKGRDIHIFSCQKLRDIKQ